MADDTRPIETKEEYEQLLLQYDARERALFSLPKDQRTPERVDAFVRENQSTLKRLIDPAGYGETAARDNADPGDLVEYREAPALFRFLEQETDRLNRKYGVDYPPPMIKSMGMAVLGKVMFYSSDDHSIWVDSALLETPEGRAALTTILPHELDHRYYLQQNAAQMDITMRIPLQDALGIPTTPEQQRIIRSGESHADYQAVTSVGGERFKGALATVVAPLMARREYLRQNPKASPRFYFPPEEQEALYLAARVREDSDAAAQPKHHPTMTQRFANIDVIENSPDLKSAIDVTYRGSELAGIILGPLPKLETSDVGIVEAHGGAPTAVPAAAQPSKEPATTIPR